MATRRVAISQDHVTALNQVEVEFYGDGGVISSWKTYVAHLNAYPRHDGASEQERQEWERRRNGYLAVLLAAIGTSLGFKIGEVEIQEGGYAPEGWWRREEAQLKALSYLVDLSEAKKLVPVLIVQPQQPQQPLPPPAVPTPSSS